MPHLRPVIILAYNSIVILLLSLRLLELSSGYSNGSSGTKRHGIEIYTGNVGRIMKETDLGVSIRSLQSLKKSPKKMDRAYSTHTNLFWKTNHRHRQNTKITTFIMQHRNNADGLHMTMKLNYIDAIMKLTIIIYSIYRCWRSTVWSLDGGTRYTSCNKNTR